MYYARVAIPLDLQPLFPTKTGTSKQELWKSLGTRDPKEAATKARPVLARWEAEFERLRSKRQPTPADLSKAVWDHYEAELERDRQDRARLPGQQDIERAAAKLTAATEAAGEVTLEAAGEFLAVRDAAQWGREQRERHLETLRLHLARGETALIEWAADDVIQREGLMIPKGSSVYRDLCQRLQRAEIEKLQRTIERDQGNFTGTPSDPIVVPPDPTMGKKQAAPGETLPELYARYQSEQKGRVTKDTWDQNAGIVPLFFEFVGETSHVSVITRKAVRDWKHALASWPRKATSIKQFDGMSFRKVIEANKTVGKPVISVRTTNRYLSAISPFCEWLLNNDYIDQDVCRGMFLNVEKKGRNRTFSDEQMGTIFSSPLFRKCGGDKQEHLPGDVEIRDWRYWIPYLAAHSGARLGEIAQMLTADVKEIHGTWCLHFTTITKESEDKSLKTAGSARVVPIHSKVVALGFLDYHKRMVKRGEKRLFPELTPDIRGHYSRTPSRFYAKYLARIGVKVDKQKNFHSFRHTGTDALRSAGIFDETFSPLLGWTKATTSSLYGNVPQGILSQRIEMVEAINYPAIT
jgi:integrase